MSCRKTRGRPEPATNYQQQTSISGTGLVPVRLLILVGSVVGVFKISDCWLTSKLLAAIPVQIAGFETSTISIIIV